MTYRYEASQVDATTWMVRRWDEQERMTESVLRGVEPVSKASAPINEETVTQLAIDRGSWA
jgi:hypothetical protein